MEDAQRYYYWLRKLTPEQATKVMGEIADHLKPKNMPQAKLYRDVLGQLASYEVPETYRKEALKALGLDKTGLVVLRRGDEFPKAYQLYPSLYFLLDNTILVESVVPLVDNPYLKPADQEKAAARARNFMADGWGPLGPILELPPIPVPLPESELRKEIPAASEAFKRVSLLARSEPGRDFMRNYADYSAARTNAINTIFDSARQQLERNNPDASVSLGLTTQQEKRGQIQAALRRGLSDSAVEDPNFDGFKVVANIAKNHILEGDEKTEFGRDFARVFSSIPKPPTKLVKKMAPDIAGCHPIEDVESGRVLAYAFSIAAEKEADLQGLNVERLPWAVLKDLSENYPDPRRQAYLEKTLGVPAAQLRFTAIR